MVYRLMSKNVAASRPAATTRIVAAATDIKLGTILTTSHLKTIEIAGALPKGAILKPENAVGRGVSRICTRGSRLSRTGWLLPARAAAWRLPFPTA